MKVEAVLGERERGHVLTLRRRGWPRCRKLMCQIMSTLTQRARLSLPRCSHSQLPLNKRIVSVGSEHVAIPHSGLSSDPGNP